MDARGRIIILILFSWALLIGCLALPRLAGRSEPITARPEGIDTAVAGTLEARLPAPDLTGTETTSALSLPASNTLEPTIDFPTATHTPTLTPVSKLDLPEGLPYIIGSSAGGRALEVYRFGAGSSERMIVAGIHGGYESNTVELAYELIEHINSHPWVIPEELTLYILPNLNPDGYARQLGIHGRTNDDNVDLNRNWFANWKAKWNLEGCWDLLPVSAGAFPHSEPEVQALAYFLMARPVEAVISYHSASLGIFAGGQPSDQASHSLAKKIAGVSHYAYPPIETGCEFTGQFVDWASEMGIAAVDIELTDHTNTDFQENLKILDAFLKWQPPGETPAPSITPSP